MSKRFKKLPEKTYELPSEVIEKLIPMIKKNSFKYEELIDCANGKLFGPGNAKLPSPPMLMFNRITNIQNNKGNFKKGLIEAELDIKEKMWYFDCHFK